MKGGALSVVCCVALAGVQTAFGFLPVATPYRARGKYICFAPIKFGNDRGPIKRSYVGLLFSHVMEMRSIQVSQ